MNTRTPEQEAAIDAAISHLENLLTKWRASRVRPMPKALTYPPAIRSAVLDAALPIIEPPAGQGAREVIAPPMRTCRICDGDAMTCSCSEAAKPACFVWPKTRAVIS